MSRGFWRLSYFAARRNIRPRINRYLVASWQFFYYYLSFIKRTAPSNHVRSWLNLFGISFVAWLRMIMLELSIKVLGCWDSHKIAWLPALMIWNMIEFYHSGKPLFSAFLPASVLLRYSIDENTISNIFVSECWDALLCMSWKETYDKTSDDLVLVL